MQNVWPEKAEPGANMDNCPPGMGGEDFGGSICQTKDGRLFFQSGKTGFWNIEVTGLQSIKELKGGSIKIGETDVKEALAFRERALQLTVGTRKITLQKKAPTLTGDFQKDFAGNEIVSFKKTEDAAVRASAAYDADNIFLGWK